ncbi:MAG TPA: hypothetical protein VFN67_02575, partial [Polyangiales bacterium]|nr:hypothetical protein [Polyangiales bacterium]
DITLRELLQRLVDPPSPAGSEWINIRTDHLPWRQIVMAAERGEVEVCRVSRKLMMRRAELDRWLSAQKICPAERASTGTTDVASKAPNDVSHLVAQLGFGSRTK